jgi:hypothetical protein
MRQLDIYELLDQLATADQIQDLLRRHKKASAKEISKEILVGGTKPDVLKNLKSAVDHGHLPPADVIQLLQESEENGSQHIF